MSLKIIRFLTIMFAAFSLSLSMAHLMELPARMQFDQELWVRVTVYEGVYDLFGSVGAVFEIGAILFAFVSSFLVRDRKSIFIWNLSGALVLLTAFAIWLIFVATANAELVQWISGPIPEDWTRTRDQWEYAHAVNAINKIVALSLLLISLLVEEPHTRSGSPVDD